MKVTATRPFKTKLRNKTVWQVQFVTTDTASGKRKVLSRKTFKTKADASDAIPAIIVNYSKTEGRITTGERMTFADLVKVAKDSFYAPATVRDGVKIAGTRTPATRNSQLAALQSYFGSFRLTNITEADVTAYCKWRESRGSRRGKQGGMRGRPLSVATLNRELSAMQKMLNYALRQGWITRNVVAGSGLIRSSAEVARTRTLAHSEETLLLACCETGEKRVTYHRKNRVTGERQAITATIDTGNVELKAAVLFALDAGMRQGEILKMRWQDLDLAAKTATVVASHTKTEKARKVPLSDRLVHELRRLPSFGKGTEVFETKTIRRSWNTALRLSGLEGVIHFHDLRATCASRLIANGIPMEQVGKIIGDTQLVGVVYKHYIRVDDQMIENARQTINAITTRSERETVEPLLSVSEYVQ